MKRNRKVRRFDSEKYENPFDGDLLGHLQIISDWVNDASTEGEWLQSTLSGSMGDTVGLSPVEQVNSAEDISDIFDGLIDNSMESLASMGLPDQAVRAVLETCGHPELTIVTKSEAFKIMKKSPDLKAIHLNVGQFN